MAIRSMSWISSATNAVRGQRCENGHAVLATSAGLFVVAALAGAYYLFSGDDDGPAAASSAGTATPEQPAVSPTADNEEPTSGATAPSATATATTVATTILTQTETPATVAPTGSVLVPGTCYELVLLVQFDDDIQDPSVVASAANILNSPECSEGQYNAGQSLFVAVSGTFEGIHPVWGASPEIALGCKQCESTSFVMPAERLTLLVLYFPD